MTKTVGDFFPKTHIKRHDFIVPYVSVVNNNIADSWLCWILKTLFHLLYVIDLAAVK